MARAQHVGKISLKFEGAKVEVFPDRDRVSQLSQEGTQAGTYMIAGGLKGFGLEVARYLARQGIKHLVLLSRSGPGSEEARRAIAELQAQNC